MTYKILLNNCLIKAISTRWPTNYLQYYFTAFNPRSLSISEVSFCMSWLFKVFRESLKVFSFAVILLWGRWTPQLSSSQFITRHFRQFGVSHEHLNIYLSNLLTPLTFFKCHYFVHFHTKIFTQITGYNNGCVNFCCSPSTNYAKEQKDNHKTYEFHE